LLHDVLSVETDSLFVVRKDSSWYEWILAQEGIVGILIVLTHRIRSGDRARVRTLGFLFSVIKLIIEELFVLGETEVRSKVSTAEHPG
jgi:hypothetical protein